jgi:hypothetical protein
MEDLSSMQNKNLAWMFYSWAVFTILVHLFGIYKSVVYTRLQKTEEYVDKYVVWEYYIIIVLCAVKLVSIAISFGGRDYYGYVLIFNSWYYILFFTFELINLSKVFNLIRIANCVSSLAKYHIYEKGQNLKKLKKLRIKFEKYFLVVFFSVISIQIIAIISWIVLQVAKN